MKCIENIKLRYAAPLGATLDDSCSSHGLTFFEVACRDLAERARMGLDLVTDPRKIAAYRHDTGDDTWGAPAGSPLRIDSTTQLI